MFKFLALVALVTVASAASVPRGFPRSPSGRIIGGEDTTIEEVPYQVSIQIFDSHGCGGSIISKYHVLTAGHCVDGIEDNPSLFKILAGTTERTSGGSLHSVAAIVRHDDYGVTDHGVPYNDIALIRVNEPFKIDETRRPIKLFADGEEAQVGAFSVITGWGDTGDWDLPTVLQTVSVPIVSKESCNAAYSSWGGLPDGQICAAYPEGGKDACQGDSGGPLAIDGRLAGIVSWGNGCAMAGQPGAYTEIASFRSWIKSNSGV